MVAGGGWGGGGGRPPCGQAATYASLHAGQQGRRASGLQTGHGGTERTWVGQGEGPRAPGWRGGACGARFGERGLLGLTGSLRFRLLFVRIGAGARRV